MADPLCACGSPAFYLTYLGGKKVGFCKRHKQRAEAIQRGVAAALDHDRADAEQILREIDVKALSRSRFTRKQRRR